MFREDAAHALSSNASASSMDTMAKSANGKQNSTRATLPPTKSKGASPGCLECTSSALSSLSSSEYDEDDLDDNESLKMAIKALRRELKIHQRDKDEMQRRMINSQAQMQEQIDKGHKKSESLQAQLMEIRLNQLILARISMINTLMQIFYFASEKEPDADKQQEARNTFAKMHTHVYSQMMCNIMFTDIKKKRTRENAMKKLLSLVDRLHHERNCALHPRYGLYMLLKTHNGTILTNKNRSLLDLLRQADEYATIIKAAVDHGDVVADEFHMMYRVFSNAPEFVKIKIGNLA